ncbi:MAG: hypothetical protein U5L04_05735 [Trueperaceae bacterium]|nr:hypothetical protein [Trueperaceae bacterium]
MLLVVLFPWAFFWGGQFPVIARYVGANARKPQASISLFYGDGWSGCFRDLFFLSFGILPLVGMRTSAFILTVVRYRSRQRFGWFTAIVLQISVGLNGKKKRPDHLGWAKPTIMYFRVRCAGESLARWRGRFRWSRRSIYSDAVSLATFMISLSLGAIIVATVRAWKKELSLTMTLFVASMLLCVIPYMFVFMTQGVLPVYTDQSMYAC